MSHREVRCLWQGTPAPSTERRTHSQSSGNETPRPAENTVTRELPVLTSRACANLEPRGLCGWACRAGVGGGGQLRSLDWARTGPGLVRLAWVRVRLTFKRVSAKWRDSPCQGTGLEGLQGHADLGTAGLRSLSPFPFLRVAPHSCCGPSHADHVPSVSAA